MGIYYFAVDYANKKRFDPPGAFCIKSPGIFHPHNPFPNMVVMKNSQGYQFLITNDVNAYAEYDFEDISDDVYQELKKIWLEYDWDVAEWKDNISPPG